MTTRHRTRLAAASLLGTMAIAAAGPSVRAGAEDISGRWNVTADGNVRRDKDGHTEVTSTRQYTLDLSVKDVDVTGAWTAATSERWALSGTWKNGKLDLTSEWREVAIGNGGATARVRWIIHGALTDGRLGGTCYIDLGAGEPVPRHWSAERATPSAS